MGSRIRKKVEHFFECFCEVVPPNEKKNSWIIQKYPEHYNDEEVLSSLCKFAFPCDFKSDTIQHYSFVLTDIESKWSYGFCRHDPQSETALVVLTYLPWHQGFYKFLDNISLLLNNNTIELTNFLTSVYNHNLNEKTIALPLNDGKSVFKVEYPKQFQLPSIPENRNLTEYYNAVDTSSMIMIFASILHERRILITSKKLSKLSACAHAANDLIYPMIWQHIFIPVLPYSLIDYLSAPMPFLIGVHEDLLKKVKQSEIGDIVLLNADTNTVETPFDDVDKMPSEVTSLLKKQLKNRSGLLGDGVSRAFLRAIVHLIGGYREALKFVPGEVVTFDEKAFIETRPSTSQPFLKNMLQLQIFQQFVEERLYMINNGLGFSDEFEMEIFRYLEKPNSKIKQQYKEWTSSMKKESTAFLKTVKEKANPAVKSAVKTVRDGGRGIKSAYKGIRSKLNDSTSNHAQFSTDLTKDRRISPTRNEENHSSVFASSNEKQFERLYNGQSSSQEDQSKSQNDSPSLSFPKLDLVNEMEDFLHFRLDNSVSEETEDLINLDEDLDVDEFDPLKSANRSNQSGDTNFKRNVLSSLNGNLNSNSASTSFNGPQNQKDICQSDQDLLQDYGIDFNKFSTFNSERKNSGQNEWITFE